MKEKPLKRKRSTMSAYNRKQQYEYTKEWLLKTMGTPNV